MVLKVLGEYVHTGWEREYLGVGSYEESPRQCILQSVGDRGQVVGVGNMPPCQTSPNKRPHITTGPCCYGRSEKSPLRTLQRPISMPEAGGRCNIVYRPAYLPFPPVTHRLPLALFHVSVLPSVYHYCNPLPL